MKQCFSIAVLIAAGMGFAPAMIVAQANSATPNGTMAQVQTAISPEDQATKEQLAKLFEVMRIRDQMLATRRIIPTMVEGQVRQQMQAMSAQIAPDAKMTVEQRAQLDQMLHKYMEKAMDMYPVDEMIADMTGLYQEHLTREDVDAMIAFYGSTAGQHVLDAQPKIAQEYVPLVMRRTAERTKTLTAEMMKDMAALKQSSGRTQPANK